VEIFVRPMRYKGCHQAHNAKVAICAILNNAYLAEITGAAKGVFTHSQKFVPYRKSCTPTHSRQIPIASDAPLATPPAVSSIGGLRTPAVRVRRATFMGPASETFTIADIGVIAVRQFFGPGAAEQRTMLQA